MSSVLKDMKGGAILTKFEVLLRHVFGRNKKNHDKSLRISVLWEKVRIRNLTIHTHGGTPPCMCIFVNYGLQVGLTLALRKSLVLPCFATYTVLNFVMY